MTRSLLRRPALRNGTVLLVASCLLTTACGARIEDSLRERAAAEALGTSSGSSSGGVGGELTGSDGALAVDGTTGGAPGSVGGAVGSSSGGASTGGAGSSGTSTGGSGGTATGSEGAAAPGAQPPGAGGKNTASDLGVTPTSITIGNVTDRTGPTPGLFQGAAFGFDAYVAYTNSLGGVNGRKLKIAAADSQVSCAQSQNAHRTLVKKVFAFAGSFGLYDDCGAKVLDENPKTVDLSYALGEGKKAARTSYPVSPSPAGYPNGMFAYWAQKYGAKTKKVGSIVVNIPSAVSAQRSARKASETAGWNWIYDQAVGATQNRFDAEVLQMQREGVEVVFLQGITTPKAVALKKQADSQGFKPVFIIPIAYSSDFVERMGGPEAAEGVVGHNLYSLFFNQDEARQIPELGLFQTWMAKTHPDAAVDLFSLYAWSSGKLLVEALKQAGQNPTRESLAAAVKKIGPFDAGGLINPGNPGTKAGSQCYVLWEIRGGKFLRQDTPAKGFRCDGKYIPA